MGPSVFDKSIYAIFFASGASALIFELLWFRQAGLAFGNSVWASSLVLSGFMGGLAAGNALAARYADRLRNPLRAYAIAEAVIAVTGVGLVYVLPMLGAALAPWGRGLQEVPWVLNLVRFVVAFLLLLAPSTAMGITLALLTKVLVGDNPRFGCVLGRLYGWNTLGAVTGVMIAELYLVRVLGVRGTALAAAGLNLFAAVVSQWLSTQAHARIKPAEHVPRPMLHNRAVGIRWLAAAFLSGFSLLALEVVWFRFLVLFVESYSVTFALMLCVVLAGIALGGLAASLWLGRSPEAYRLGSVVAFAAGILCIASYAVFPSVMRPFIASAGNISGTFDILRLCIPLVFPVSFLSGIFFTLAGAALRGALASESVTVGLLTLANTLGALLGSLVGGFVLLPVLGMERSFFILALLYSGVGLLLLVGRPITTRIGIGIAVVFIASFAFPFGLMKGGLIHMSVNRWLVADDSTKIAAVREGLTETIVHLETQLLGRPLTQRMLANSVSLSTTSYAARRYQKLYVYWPMAVNPDLKHALLIAYGVGNTAKAMTDSRSLESIDVVDISRDIIGTDNLIYPNMADSPLHDPRVQVHIEDGRYFLQTTDRRFDLITGEPPPPRNAGVANLYTREYFQLLYDRLADGGIVTYWLPIDELTEASLKAVLSAFSSVFEDCSLWNGMGTSLMIVGLRNAKGRTTEEQFSRQWHEPVVAAEMKRLGLETPEQLGALFIGDAEYIRGLVQGSPPLVDNYPKRVDAANRSQQAARESFESLIDVRSQQARFQTSPSIRRLWPERLLTGSLSYFEFQATINAHFYGLNADSALLMDRLHGLLTRTSLRAPVLWCLGSDADIQRVVAEVPDEVLAEPLMQYHLGARLISERNYAAAVEALRRSEGSASLQPPAFRLQSYALCMAGKTAEAQSLAREHAAQIITDDSGQVFWSWMKKNFGIDPLATPQLAQP